jgi:hypothetical protein
MLRTATLCTLALGFAFGPDAQAQDPLPVTIRDINAIPQENIDQLNALGADVTLDDIQDLALNELAKTNARVSFTAVVLSDPYNSGLRTFVPGSGPGSVFVMVRDVNAATMGYEGMGTQLNDGTLGSLDLVIGDVIDVVGTVEPFVNGGGALTMQVVPESFEVVDAVGADDPLLDPVLIETTDLNRFVESGDPFNRCLIDWNNYPDLNGQFVRIEGARVAGSSVGANERVAILFESFPAENPCYTNLNDTSLRYRNDRDGSYEPPFNVRPASDPYIPPDVNDLVNVQGFAFIHGFDGGFGYEALDGGVFQINPMEDRGPDEVAGISLGPDIVVTGQVDGLPPVVEAPEVDLSVIPGDGPVGATVTITPSEDATIASAELVYSFSSSPGEQRAPLTDNGDGTFSGTIPAAPDGDFVTVFAEATDSEGRTDDGASVSYRVLYGGIDDVEDVQLTENGGPGDSPFRNYSGAMNIEATVQTAPFEIQEGSNTFELFTIQDGSDLFDGVGVLYDSDLGTLNVGDQVTITAGTIAENFGFTRLEDVSLTVTGGGSAIPPVELTTNLLSQEENGPFAEFSEGYEGMLVRFVPVIVTDTDAGFGAFRVSSNGDDDDAIVVEDDASVIPSDFNTTLDTEAQYDARGIWYYSFSDYKLLLTSLNDFAIVLASESGPATGVFGVSAFPNPTSGTATVRFSIQEQADVRLAVYDVMGREVAVLQEGELASSQYDAVLPNDLAAGLYVIRLQAGDQTATAKVSVVR